MTVAIFIQKRRMNGMMTMRAGQKTFRTFPKRRVVTTPLPTTLRNSMVLQWEGAQISFLTRTLLVGGLLCRDLEMNFTALVMEVRTLGGLESEKPTE